MALTAVPAAANGSHIAVTAKEDGCPGDKTFCFEVVFHGSQSLVAGEIVTVALTNDAANSSPHNLCVTFGASDPAHRATNQAGAKCTSGDVDPGASADFMLTVPEDKEKAYYWCHVPGHEQLGMWGDWQVLGMSKSDNMVPPEDDGKSGAPGFGVPLALLAAVAVVAARPRRSA